MCDTEGKSYFIEEYFKNWENDIDKAAEMICSPRYHLEGILVLSCYIDAFAGMYFPEEHENRKAYLKVLREHSGHEELFEQIDLLFFYQWPTSKYIQDSHCSKLQKHTEIVEALSTKYGSIEDIKAGTRYISQDEFVEIVKAANIKGFDEQNLRAHSPRFSLAELCYKYIRCAAVHDAEHPLFNESIDENCIKYRPWTAITAQVLLETVRNIHRSLWEKCREAGKWPQELE